MDTAGDFIVSVEDGSEEAQEDEGGVDRRRGLSRRVVGGSEALNPIRRGGEGGPFRVHPDILWGGRSGRIRTEGTGGAPTAAGDE